MKALKKALLGITAMAMTVAMFSFVACDNSNNSNSTSSDAGNSSSEETSSPEESSPEEEPGGSEVTTNITGTYSGEYKYDNTYAAGSYYGVKVSVVVADGVITSVSTVDSDYIEVSDSNTTYGWDQTVYTTNKDSLLAAYSGKTVDEILALTVAVEDSGEPTIQLSDEFVSYDSDLIITGATQCSGRLLLAVQDALTLKTYEGEYKYANTYAEGSYYGVKVSVAVRGGIIESVSTIDSDYIEVSESNASYGWEQTVYTTQKDTLLAAYSGKTVEEILALTVAVEDSGEPTIQSSDEFVEYDSDLIITGATQCSGRLLLAVQDALTLKTYEGEYKYANTYAEGSYYGVKVSVAVRGGIIESVSTIDSDYIEVSDSNTTYGWEQTVYTTNKDSLLAAYSGKTVEEILALTVAVEDSGEPIIQSSDEFVNYDSDLIITGATQCSGRLLLAVQNALASFAA